MTWWYRASGYGFENFRKVNFDENPCPTICASGIGGTSHSQYYIEDDGKETYRMNKSKPPYVVPSMKEIAALPWNGYKVASTFSGCGGSSLGYRMAGYKVVYASEFVESARASYIANASPDTYLDHRDIRKVSADDMLEKLGMQKGELDILDGSPPCASFSTAGARERKWGKVNSYSDRSQRTDDLFFEYTRLIDGVRPKVFIAENVSGMVKGTAKGYFIEILQEMRSLGYEVSCKLLNSKWLGVPQARERVIFIGVRSDLGMQPVYPTPANYFYSVRDALPNMIQTKSGDGWQSADMPNPTITASLMSPTAKFGGGGFCEAKRGPNNEHSDLEYVELYTDKEKALRGLNPDSSGPTKAHEETMKRRFTIEEVRVLCSFPADFVLCGNYSKQWERMGRAVPPLMMKAVASTVKEEILDKIPKHTGDDEQR